MDNIKSYSFFDIIGTKDLIKKEEIESTLTYFYKKTSNFVNNNLWEKYGIGYYQLCEDGERECVFSVKANLISDSVLLEIDSKFPIELLIKVSFEFQKYLLECDRKIMTYFIVNRDLEYNINDITSNIKVTLGNDNIEKFRCFVLPGKAWINIYKADKKIREMKDWHKKYNAYYLNPPDVRNDIFSIQETVNITDDSNNIINISAIKYLKNK